MTAEPALDLARIDPPAWRILIGETVYGPYTLGQLQGFVAEGRIALTTKIAEGDGAPFIPAERHGALQGALRDKWKDATRQPRTEGAHNYLIITRFSTESDTVIVQALNGLGTFGEAMPGVFILSSEARLSTLQTTLRARLGSTDQLLIVDATDNRLGWFNLGPEADVQLKSIWQTQNKRPA